MRGILLATTLLAITTATRADDKPVTRMIENTFRNWTLEEVPAPVQKTIRNQAAGHKISDIDREDRAGKTVWEVEFAGGDRGEDREIHIDNEGRLVDGDGKPLPNAGPVIQRDSTPAPNPDKENKPVVATKQTPKVLNIWADLPKPIQHAAQKFGGEKSVRDIDHEKREGQEVWELEFERSDKNVELHFLADGRILEQLDSDPEKR